MHACMHEVTMGIKQLQAATKGEFAALHIFQRVTTSRLGRWNALLLKYSSTPTEPLGRHIKTLHMTSQQRSKHTGYGLYILHEVDAYSMAASSRWLKNMGVGDDSCEKQPGERSDRVKPCCSPFFPCICFWPLVTKECFSSQDQEIYRMKYLGFARYLVHEDIDFQSIRLIVCGLMGLDRNKSL